MTMMPRQTFAGDRVGGPGAGDFPGFGAANAVVGPSNGGTAGTAARSDHQHPFPNVADLAALAAVDAVDMNNGTPIWVATLKTWFVLTNTTITADGRTIVTALNKAASRWCRVLWRNLAWEVVTSWNIDPLNGDDEAAGTTSATSIKTITELRDRLYDANLSASVTVTIRGDVPATDAPEFTCRFGPGVQITFIGTLGAVTGFGGAAYDNTLFTGNVTTYTAGAAVPTADDVQVEITSLPVSFTASGLMAAGVIARRTVTSTRHFYLLEDLGSKTARITVPMNNGGPLSFASNPLAVGNPVSFFQMWTMPTPTFRFADAECVRLDTLYEIQGNPAITLDGGARGIAPIRSRIWIGDHSTSNFITLGVGLTNCMLSTGGDTIFTWVNMVPPNIIGGGAREAVQRVYGFFGYGGIGGAFATERVRLRVLDAGYFPIEAALACHDCTSSCLEAVGSARISFLASPGFSGKGNTGKLANVQSGSSLHYGSSSPTPPFVAGSTTDASPITVGATSYAVAGIPAVAETVLTPQVFFP